jgi:hypothetical protein
MLSRLLVVTACWSLIGCSEGEPATPDGADLDLYEPVLRKLVSGPAMDANGMKIVYYVSLGDEDSPEKLLARFRGHKPPVEPASHYRPDNRAVAAHMVRFQQEVQWLDADHPRVFVLSYPAAETLKCGTPYPVALRRDGNRWVVEDQ